MRERPYLYRCGLWHDQAATARRQRPRELPGVDVRTGGRGVVDRGEQYQALRREPGESLVPIGEVFGAHPRSGRIEDDQVTRRVQQPVRGVRRVQVMVQQPMT
jgi:hypothetical protein